MKKPMSNFKKKLQKTVMPTVMKLQPVARVAARVAGFAVRIQKPTVLSTIGMVSTGLNAITEVLNDSGTACSAYEMFLARGQVMAAAAAAGANVAVERTDNNEWATCNLHGTTFNIYPNGNVMLNGDDDGQFTTWLQQAIDNYLGTAVSIRCVTDEKGGGGHDAHPIAMTKYDNAQATRILQSTLPLLDGGRCILLDGKPGVGKTTMAQIIARESELGRVVMLDASVVGQGGGYSNFAAPASRGGGGFQQSLALLNPGVIIVDDIDKMHLSLDRLEAMRAVAKLVILTANNGQYDEILDGAMIRAGRVDEVFTIDPVPMPREAPFTMLSDEAWDEVREWPVAYLNEVRKRLQYRPDDLRLDDLRARLTRKTRSGEHLL